MEKLLARQAGHPLPSRLSSVRDSLKSCLTRAATNAAASAPVVFEPVALPLEKDVNAAAEALGITPGGVRWALSKGRLGGRKLGRQWLISDEDIELYKLRSA
jgi:excisionase family DNA binding protein